MPGKVTRSTHSKADVTTLAVALLAAVGMTGVALLNNMPDTLPPQQADDGIIDIDYRADAGEWPATTHPTLCQIVNNYGLGGEAVAATLWLNRGISEREARCADPNRPINVGGVTRLAISAPPTFRECVAEAATCASVATSGVTNSTDPGDILNGAPVGNGTTQALSSPEDGGRD